MRVILFAERSIFILYTDGVTQKRHLTATHLNDHVVRADVAFHKINTETKNSYTELMFITDLLISFMLRYYLNKLSVRRDWPILCSCVGSQPSENYVMHNRIKLYSFPAWPF